MQAVVQELDFDMIWKKFFDTTKTVGSHLYRVKMAKIVYFPTVS